MPKRIKLVIDSVIEDRIRILITSKNEEKKAIEADFQVLKNILKKKDRIAEGSSFQITFQKTDDYDALVSKEPIKEFKPKGEIKVKTTTRTEAATIKELQEKLGLKRV